MQIISNGKTYADNNIDIKNKIVTFESGDDLNPEELTDMAKITTGHTMKDYLRSLSLIGKNVRYLIKMLGSTDVSTIADGTLTGAIGALNTGIYFEKMALDARKDNLLLVDLINGLSDENKTRVFSKPSENSPVDNANFMGIWKCYRRSNIHVLVQLIEMYPVAGRLWFNFYNSGNWSGWKSITPS